MIQVPESKLDNTLASSRSRRQQGGKKESRKKDTGGTTHSDSLPAKRSSAKATFPWINGQIISAAETGQLSHFISTIDAYLMQMNLVNLTTAFHRLAKMTANDRAGQIAVRSSGLLPKLLSALKDALHSSNTLHSSPKTQVLTNVTWALATMQVPDIQLIEVLAAVANWKLTEFKEFELATLLWAFAKLGSLESTVNAFSLPIFVSAAAHVCRAANMFTLRGLVMVAWAFATVRLHDPRIFHVIAVELMPQLLSANSQELANTAWAFSTANVHKQELFHMLADVAVPRLVEFKPQELSSILWSFAAIGDNNDAFFEAAAEAVQRINLQAQQLANILWALTRVRARQQSTQKAVLSLLPRCVALIQTFKPQELASVALAAAKSFGVQRDEIDGTLVLGVTLDLPSQVSEFFFAALPLVALDLTDFSGQSIANIASSFLTVQVGLDTTLFPVIGCEVMTRVKSIENSALLLLLKTLPYAPTSASVNAAIGMLFSEAARRMHCFQPREIQMLMRICSSHAGLQDGSDMVELNDLRSRCLALASCGVAGQLMDTVEHIPRSDVWSAPMTVEVADLGLRSTSWDAEATKNLRESIESAYSRRDVARASEVSKDNSNSTLPHYVFSVKNTFLDVMQADNSDESSDSDDAPPLPPLPPALSIIPASVSPEKLAAYRADYARFRVGNAIGAKGELSTTLA